MSNTFLALVDANGNLSLDRLYSEGSNGVLKAQTRLEKDSGVPLTIARVRLEVVEVVPREALLKVPAKVSSAAPVATEGNTSELETGAEKPE
jgi:hypothetical protein